MDIGALMIRGRRAAAAGRVRTCGAAVALLLAAAIAGVPATASAAGTEVDGFAEVTAFTGLVNPTAVRFAPDGRVFVAEKRGTIQMYDTVDDTTATQVADLRTEVHNFLDRGLLGLAVDPGFPARPYLYALYTFDGPIGGTAPRWGSADSDSDPCPGPSEAEPSCAASAKLVRLTLDGSATTRQDLVHDWCQDAPTHTVGDLVFGPDGALYASAGEAAGWDDVDHGQAGPMPNPCGDPEGEGGALRAQDLRTPDDPVSLDGTVIRVSPDTGLALPDNPAADAADANAQRIVAFGMRNPFRMAVRPGTGEVWLGDVGWDTDEEINRLRDPLAGVANFGWPCYEGDERQERYAPADLGICEDLYEEGDAETAPWFGYRHGRPVSDSDDCGSAEGASISGIAFRSAAAGSSWPAAYDGALFFADYARSCIWVMTQGDDGLPDRSTARTFLADAAGPVGLDLSPQGELFYPDVIGGTIRRVVFGAGEPDGENPPSPAPNSPPQPQILTPPSGATYRPGDVISFSGSATDPEDGALPDAALSWELVLRHCPEECHVHPVQQWTGTSSGTFTAPAHESPVHLELSLTATDAGGATATVRTRLDGSPT
jgi:glucose/arabinose dehydrogenase